MKISNRLKQISSLIDDNLNIIDVGCDHALLDIYLVLNRENINVIASDNKRGPLLKAKENVSFFNLEDKIKLKLGDGLDTIEEESNAIIISGMGGNTIINILKDKNLSNIKEIILSPQSEIKETRIFMNKINYSIEKEIIIKDNEKFYIAIKYVKGKEKLSDEELEYGPYLLKNKNELFIEYYGQYIKELENIIEKVPEKEINNIKIKIEKMRKIIEV